MFDLFQKKKFVKLCLCMGHKEMNIIINEKQTKGKHLCFVSYMPFDEAKTKSKNKNIDKDKEVDYDITMRTEGNFTRSYMKIKICF